MAFKKPIELNTSMLGEYLEKGIDQRHWYANESARLLELLPEFEGLPIIRTFAVTSMTTSIEANVHLALKALLQMQRGQPFVGYLPTQITYLDLINKGEDVPGRKIMSFINALEGVPNSVVVDIWMCRAFGIEHKRVINRRGKSRIYFKAPSKREYDAIESYCWDWAARIEVEARQIQSMVWSGIKRMESTLSKTVSWSSLVQKKRGMFSYGRKH